MHEGAILLDARPPAAIPFSQSRKSSCSVVFRPAFLSSQLDVGLVRAKSVLLQTLVYTKFVRLCSSI